MERVTLLATAAFGVESVVARELRDLGYEDVSVEDGRALFEAPLDAVPRCNLWLRSASRVQIVVGRFEARDFGELFDRTKALPWEDWIPGNGAFPVNGRSVRSQLHSVPDCQRIVKKAIVERLKTRHTVEWFEEDGPTFAVEVALLKDTATLTLDTTGPALHERGYRTRSGHAPLRETLAAALVLLGYWDRDRPFLDPCCGSGTLPIEAAMIGRNVAPGRRRSFAAEEWPRIPTELWDRAREEADAAVLPSFNEPLVGADIDPKAIESARFHAGNTPVADDVRFEVRPLAKTVSNRRYGCVVTNPPYGERVGEEAEVVRLYEEMGRRLPGLEGWSIYVLTSHPEFESLYGHRADRRRKLYNGRIECTFHQFLGPPPPWKRGRRE